MEKKKLKILIFATLIIAISSVPVISHADNKNTNDNVTITQESSIEITDNWLTREVARQLNKNVRDLKEEDFLDIKKIDLRYEKIDREIPSEIGLLKNLEYLDLNYCRLDGNIPDALGNLPNLTYLDLGDNEFKELPENLEAKFKNESYKYGNIESKDTKLTKGWYFLKGKWCYIDRNGQRLKGTQTVDGKQYEFNDNGELKLGWDTENGQTYYYDATNGIVKNDWKVIEGKWYYFDSQGVLQKGLQNIKGVKFYLDDSTGAMITGWKQIDNKMYYFSSTGGMAYGWITEGNNTYYLDESTGQMVAGEDKVINGKKYRFYAEGILVKDSWLNSNTYAQSNGEIINVNSDFSHSSKNFDLFKYMTDKNNRISVDQAAVKLHDGDESNNCVYFLSEALRRVGVPIPTWMCNTYVFEDELKSLGFVYSYDLSQLKPGDIVFTNNYTHVYTFMGWAEDGNAYVVDNQSYNYGGKILHERNVFSDTYSTDRATHFFYYGN